MLQLVTPECVGNGVDGGRVVYHAHLYSQWADIVHHGIYLPCYYFWRHGMYGADTGSVLHRDGGDGRGGITPEGRHSLYVCLNACPTRRVASGNGQCCEITSHRSKLLSQFFQTGSMPNALRSASTCLAVRGSLISNCANESG